MENLRQTIVSYDQCKSSLENAYADLASLDDANANEIKAEIQKLIDRCALSAVILDDMYEDMGT